MIKFLNIFIAFSLLVSTFDIIDVSDITLGSEPIFTSEDFAANQENDRLDDLAHRAPALVFTLNLEKTAVFAFNVNIKEDFFVSKPPGLYNEYINSLDRPPRTA